MGSKNVWRAKMLETRSELGPEKSRQLNREICKNLLKVLSGPQMSAERAIWAGYRSFKWEADPSQAIIDSASSLRWIYPRVTKDFGLEFWEPRENSTPWIKNSWGIWEPDPAASLKVEIKDCSGVLFPGLAFDRQGHRLGYGKGLYDKALAGFGGLKVGIAFSVQMTDTSLPSDDSDVLMDFIVTDHEIVKVQDGRH